MAEADALPLAHRTRGRGRRQQGHLGPGRDRERHILAGLTAADVGGKQAQGGLQGPIHPRQVEGQQIPRPGIAAAAIAHLDRRDRPLNARQGGVNPGLVTADQGIAEAKAIASGNRKRACHWLAEIEIAKQLGQVEGHQAVVVAGDRPELAGHLGLRIGGDHLQIDDLATGGPLGVRSLEVQPIAAGFLPAWIEGEGGCGGGIAGDAEPGGRKGLALLLPGAIALLLQPVDAGAVVEGIPRIPRAEQSVQAAAEAAARDQAPFLGDRAGGSSQHLEFQALPATGGLGSPPGGGAEHLKGKAEAATENGWSFQLKALQGAEPHLAQAVWDQGRSVAGAQG